MRAKTGKGLWWVDRWTVEVDLNFYARIAGTPTGKYVVYTTSWLTTGAEFGSYAHARLAIEAMATLDGYTLGDCYE